MAVSCCLLICSKGYVGHLGLKGLDVWFILGLPDIGHMFGILGSTFVIHKHIVPYKAVAPDGNAFVVSGFYNNPKLQTLSTITNETLPYSIAKRCFKSKVSLAPLTITKIMETHNDA